MKKKKKYKEKQSHKADAKKLMVPNFFKKWNERKQSQQNKPFFWTENSTTSRNRHLQAVIRHESSQLGLFKM